MSAILLYDTMGGSATGKTVGNQITPGTDLHVVQIAEALARKGHEVTVANSTTGTIYGNGVAYINHEVFNSLPAPSFDAVILHRASRMPDVETGAIAINATDIYTPAMLTHAHILSHDFNAKLVCVSRWQADQYASFAREIVVIPPMLDSSFMDVEREHGLFVFASAAFKGLPETLTEWAQAQDAACRPIRLVVVSPGYGGDARALNAPNAERRVVDSPDEYRRWIARAEGLFYVNGGVPETFGLIAAMAERYGARAHIMAKTLGGLPSAMTNPEILSTTVDAFHSKFQAALRDPADPRWYGQPPYRDLSPDALVNEWEKALGIL